MTARDPAATAGAAGLRHLGRRLTLWRIAPRWYLLAIARAVLYLVAAGVAATSTGSTADLGSGTVRGILVVPSTGLLVVLFLRGPMGEELGLRGFALPRVQQRMSPFTASLVLGVVWGLWHLPVLVGRDSVSVAAFLLLVLTLTFVFTWLFNGSGGSLIPPLLLHATQNWDAAFETVFPGIAGTDWELLSSAGVLLLGIVAAIAVRRGRHPAVTALTS